MERTEEPYVRSSGTILPGPRRLCRVFRHICGYFMFSTDFQPFMCSRNCSREQLTCGRHTRRANMGRATPVTARSGDDPQGDHPFPTAPSVCSRMMSACPAWRAVSSIMWT